MRDFWDTGWAFLLILLGFVLGAFLFVAFLMKGAAEIGMPGSVAEIESIRRDAALVDEARAEDVIGQVTQWNQTISSSQAYNRMFIVGWFVPDGWDEIELIPILTAAP